MWKKLVGGAAQPTEVVWEYEDLPSPKTDEDMKRVIQEETAIRKKWIHGTEEDGWKFFQNVEDIEIQELAIPGTSIHVVRACGIVTGIDLEEMLRSFSEGGLEERKKVNSDIIEHEKVYQVEGQPDMYVSYSAFSTPLGVTDREFLTLRDVLREEDGSVLIVSQSVNIESKPFRADRVRATTRNGRLFIPMDEPGKFKVTLVDHVDPRGSVPGWIVNRFKKKAAEAIIKMQQSYGKK